MEFFEINETDSEFIENPYLAFLKQNWNEVLRLTWQRFSIEERYADFVQDGKESLIVISAALYDFAKRSHLPLAFKSLCVAGAINTSIANKILSVERQNAQHYFVNAYWLLCKTEPVYFAFHEQNDMLFLNGQLLMDRPRSDLDEMPFVDDPQTQLAKSVLAETIANFDTVGSQIKAIEEKIKQTRAANQ